MEMRFSCCKIPASVVAVVACGILWGGRATAAEQTTNWLTGAKFQKQLAQPVGIIWDDVPLRKATSDLARVHRVAVLIDRRVDPSQKLKLRLTDVSLQEALEEIARSRRLGVSLLGSVVYFGPPQSSARLRTIAALRSEEIRRLSPDLQRKFLLPKRFTWDDFAMPRELLEQLAEQTELTIAGLGRVPHDLWAAADLPSLSPVEQLTLILVQFDLTFEVGSDGRSISLTPLPEEVALVRDYPGGSDPEETARKLGVLAPDARIKVVGEKVYVKGLLEDHQRITSPRRPKRPAAAPVERDFENKRFTLDANQPAGALLRQLADQLELELKIDGEGLKQAGISLDRRVRFSVKDATIDELLLEVAKPLGLSLRRQGNVVEIGPAE